MIKYIMFDVFTILQFNVTCIYDLLTYCFIMNILYYLTILRLFINHPPVVDEVNETF